MSVGDGVSDGRVPVSTGPGLVRSVLWSWLGIGATLLSGLIVTPLVLKSVGAANYGIWMLVFAFAESAWMFDLGLRSATSHFLARATATGDDAEINRILSTSLVFFVSLGVCVLAVGWIASLIPGGIFRIPADQQVQFRTVLAIVLTGWAVSAALAVFDACLEGLGRFDVTSRITVTTVLVRSAVTLYAVRAGVSIEVFALITAVSQVAASCAGAVAVRRIVPTLRLGPAWVNRQTFRQLVGYGGLALAASMASRAFVSGAPLIIGLSHAPAEVAAFAVPMRMVQLLLEPIFRIGVAVRYRVTALATASAADGRAIVALVTRANRYGLLLILVAACALLPFATHVLRAWATPELAVRSTAALQLLLVGAIAGQGAQFSSGLALFGLGRHRAYALTMVAGSVVALGAMLLVVPDAGATGAAAVVAVTMAVVQGLMPSVYFARALSTNWLGFVRAIWDRPVLAALPTLGIGVLLAPTFAPAAWMSALFAAACVALTCAALGIVLAVPRDDRLRFLDGMARRLRPRVRAQ